VHVYISQAPPGQIAHLEEGDDLIVAGHRSPGKLSQQGDDLCSVLQVAARQLADDERMAEDLPGLQESDQPLVAVSQVIDPDRRVDQDGYRSRRLGIGLDRFSVPPSLARRLALSRSISASSPSLTSLVFSLVPVISAAFFRSSSSMFRVVLIVGSPHRFICMSMYV
jgi:hypothetical protein